MTKSRQNKNPFFFKMMMAERKSSPPYILPSELASYNKLSILNALSCLEMAGKIPKLSKNTRF